VKQREAQADTIGAVRGTFGPTLAATAAVGEGGIVNASSSQATGLGFFWDVGLSATWPLFEGGLRVGQVRQAEATLDNLDAQQNLEALQVRLDVNSAQLAVRAAKATIGAAQDAVANAHEQLRLAEQRYATGVGSIIELDDAQVAFTTAAAQLVQARYQLASARAQFLAAMGRT
jgi:outer membrane protein